MKRQACPVSVVGQSPGLGEKVSPSWLSPKDVYQTGYLGPFPETSIGLPLLVLQFAESERALAVQNRWLLCGSSFCRWEPPAALKKKGTKGYAEK